MTVLACFTYLLTYEVGGLTAELEARRGRLEVLGLAEQPAGAPAAGNPNPNPNPNPKP